MYFSSFYSLAINECVAASRARETNEGKAKLSPLASAT